MKKHDFEDEYSDYGYNNRRKLYRLPRQGKIAGVCAGVADFFGYEAWVIRLIAVAAVILGLPFVILIYVVLWFALDVKPSERKDKKERHRGQYRPTVGEVWKAGNDPKKSVKDLNDIFDVLVGRLENIEKYVTSKRYALDSEFSKMEKSG